MARKSRKESAKAVVQEPVSTCRAALYVRLSVEDSHTHSASIETQQMIIAQFLERNPDIQVYDTYIDNGTSGTTFHRPAFQKMLSDIESGFVNCVIVKDLSRLGRNTIDTGYYIEQYFRLRNVRFIAVNENFDTAAPEDSHSGIIIPLRNMINEAYALDIGRKIKAQQRQAMKDGKFIGSRTPYGYLKAPDDCHQLIIDPVAAPVVKKIFQWASEGIGLNTITVRLNEAGYLPPSHYKNTQGIITHENLMGNGNWNTRTVARILHAQVYTGDLVQGRTKIVDHQQVEVSEMEWTVVHDTHEAIISHELFEAVQKKLDETAQHCKEREVQAYSPNILKGKIFCAHCGGSLHRHRNFRKKSADVYLFYCLTNSMSIENQRLVLNEFAAAMPEALNSEVLEFVDNGYSGTNFERPQVQKLIEMVRENRIDCIIVKDFSRFGRNSIETGYFLERVFPLFHTRFISVSDDYDSNNYKGDTGGMDVAFKYLISEYYSRDMSIKTKSAKYAKMQRGEYQSTICPYGYRKSADGRMEPDPEAAAVVLLIFQLAAEGKNAPSIAKELYKRGIPTPAEYKITKGQKTHDVSRTHGIWCDSTIVRYLADERYTGTYIIGKRAVLEVGGNNSRFKDRSRWYIIPDHHPAIVDKVLFDKVQEPD